MNRIILFLMMVCLGANAQDAKMNFSLQKKISEDRNSTREISLMIKGDVANIRQEVEALGGTFKYSTGDIASIRIPLNKVISLKSAAGIQKIESSERLQPMNDQLIRNNHVIEVQEGFNLPQEYNGEGVVIGIIDEGIDYTHPDFRDEFNHTRIKYVWDQSIINTNSSTQAQPYGYGKEYVGSQIDTATQHHDSQFSHGSHVAGIAAGNGRAMNNYKGVAPKADLIIVKMDLGAPDNEFLSNLVDAVKYIFDRADALGEPAVINISLGTYFGSHDGKDVQSEAINNLISSSPGHVVVCSAGNAGNAPIHLGYNLSSDTNFTWMQFSSTYVYIQAWCDSADFPNAHFGIGVDRINDYITPISSLSFSNSNSTQDTVVYDTIYSGGARVAIVQSLIQNWGDRYSFDYAIYPDSVLNVNAGDTSRYFWKFMTTGSGRMDAWSFDMIFDNLPDANNYSPITYYKKPDTDQTIVSSFTCSEKVITVGSSTNRNYYTNANFTTTMDTSLVPGNLSSFSSRGPTRDGRVKPDIVATGEWVLSCGAQSELNILAALEPQKVAAGKKHKRSSGTSMSSPVVAGIAALYLQKNPTATWDEVKNAIIGCADVDNATGSNLPNNNWGYGKVNGYNAIKGCSVGINELSFEDFDFYPNPSHGNIKYHFDLSTMHYKNAEIEIKDVLGKTIHTIRLNEISSTNEIQNTFGPGVYIGELKIDGKIICSKKIIIL